MNAKALLIALMSVPLLVFDEVKGGVVSRLIAVQAQAKTLRVLTTGTGLIFLPAG